MTGFVITAVVYFVIVFSHIPQVMLCTTAALSAVAVLEIFNATGKCRNKGLQYGCAIAGIILTILPVPKYEMLLYILFPLSDAAGVSCRNAPKGFWLFHLPPVR